MDNSDIHNKHKNAQTEPSWKCD